MIRKEKNLRVSFQGEPGAYSEAAVLAYFPEREITFLPCQSFEAVFRSVEGETSDLGFIPIENSLAGSIHQNYDLLLRNSLWVIGEYQLRIQHCLIAEPGVHITEIRRIISHPQALAQCDGYLHQMPDVKVEQAYDTAGSVKLIHEQGDKLTAAIASRRAAALYNMVILAENIEDNPQNFTRFLIISKQPVLAAQKAKTSIVFSLLNKPGTLFKALSVFALRDIDLAKIESRPLIGTPWDYLFYVDFYGSTQDQSVVRALNHLQEYAKMMRVLGSYPYHML
ncbi:MAG: prephenate dehydratase [Anaerolineaceae bacterium]